ncbi:hypothetical protein D3C81_1993110 [compost metagenome]
MQLDADAGNALEQRCVIAVGHAIEVQAHPRDQRIALADHHVDGLERRAERTAELGGLIGSQVDIGHGNAAYARQDGAGDVEIGGGGGLRRCCTGQRQHGGEQQAWNRKMHGSSQL